jgi:hypothetical protein
MKKIWINYSEWEDYKAGFFGTIKKSDEINTNINRLLTSTEFLENGIEVLKKWSKSSHHNMSDDKSNRRSYIGQAVCCFVYGYSCKTTANSWQYMSKEDQDKANKIADILIKVYEELFYDNSLTKEISNENLS